MDTTGCGDKFNHMRIPVPGCSKGFQLKMRRGCQRCGRDEYQHLGGRSGIPRFDDVLEFLVSRGSFLWIKKAAHIS